MAKPKRTVENHPCDTKITGQDYLNEDFLGITGGGIPKSGPKPPRIHHSELQGRHRKGLLLLRHMVPEAVSLCISCFRLSSLDGFKGKPEGK